MKKEKKAVTPAPERPMANAEKEPFIDVLEVVEITGFTRGYIYRLTSQKQIPHYKFGTNTVRFRKSEILSWFENSSVKIEV